MPIPVAASFGAQLAQGAAQTGTSGLISGALGQLFGGMNARRQWKYQKKAMALQQQYALEQMAKQAEYAYGNWQKQFDYENSYNDPSKVFERYSAAGVSPAAVLGSSGVGINATMSGGSGGSVGASGPSGGPGLPGAGPLDMTALSQNMLTGSEARRNSAAANRDQAEADLTNAQNFGKERFLSAFDLSTQLTAAGIKEKTAQANYISALQVWQDSRNKYADLIATNDWLKSVGECAQIAEENRRLRAQNDAEIPLMSQAAAANIAYIQALTGNLRANSRMTNLQADDFQEWFRVNWETEIEVDDVDKDGKVSGKRKMTGRDIAAYLLGLDYTAGQQARAAEGFMNWQRKHPMLTSIVDRVAGGVAAGAAMRMGSRRPMSRTRTVNEEYYDGQGSLKGVKVGRYDDIPLKY